MTGVLHRPQFGASHETVFGPGFLSAVVSASMQEERRIAYMYVTFSAAVSGMTPSQAICAPTLGRATSRGDAREAPAR